MVLPWNITGLDLALLAVKIHLMIDCGGYLNAIANTSKSFQCNYKHEWSKSCHVHIMFVGRYRYTFITYRLVL